MSIRVTKRDGSIVPIDVYKIKKVVAFGCGGTDCDPLELEMDAHVQFRDGITTEEIQKMVIQTAVEKITHETPEWQFVASKLYLYDVFKKVCLNRKLDKKPYTGFYEFIQMATEQGLYSPVILETYSKEEIEALANRFGVKVNFKEPYGFAKLPNGLLKTIPVYDRNLTDGEHKVLYTIKPHTTKKYIDPEYFPMTPQDIADNDPPFYNYEDDNIFKFSHTKIDCVANQPEKNHYEIFLDCDGSVYPCCFIGSRMNYGEMQLKNMQGDTDIVLSESNTIDKILSSNYYKKVLPAGIDGTFEGDLTLGGKTNYCLTCVDCCGMNMELSHIKKT